MADANLGACGNPSLLSCFQDACFLSENYLEEKWINDHWPQPDVKSYNENKSIEDLSFVFIYFE